MTISASGEESDNPVLPDLTGSVPGVGASSNSTPLITKSSALVLLLDGCLIVLGTFLAVGAGLIEGGNGSSWYIFVILQMIGIFSCLLLGGGYRHPVEATIRTSFTLTICAVVLSSIVILSAVILPTLSGSLAGWDVLLAILLHAGLVCVLIVTGRMLLVRCLQWHRRRLAIRPGILLIHEAGAVPGSISNLTLRFGGCEVTGGEVFAQDGPSEFDQFGDIVFVGHWANRDALRQAVLRVSEMAVNVHVHSIGSVVPVTGQDQSQEPGTLKGIPVVTLSRRPLSSFDSAVKRVFDVGASLALIAFLLPVLALIAAAIWIDGEGPILFRQIRHGYNNKPFQILKFRSMRPVPHATGEEVVQATRIDMRVTRVGRILRKLSLDELPQIFNVLMGDMSLVGPRPHAIAHHRQYCSLIDGYRLRHRMRPGITGWAQIHGYRGETDTLDKMAGRVAYDLDYIEHWSLTMDLKILLATVAVGFIHENAY